MVRRDSENAKLKFVILGLNTTTCFDVSFSSILYIFAFFRLNSYYNTNLILIYRNRQISYKKRMSVPRACFI